jgi:hypothetical protein
MDSIPRRSLDCEHSFTGVAAGWVFWLDRTVATSYLSQLILTLSVGRHTSLLNDNTLFLRGLSATLRSVVVSVPPFTDLDGSFRVRSGIKHGSHELVRTLHILLKVIDHETTILGVGSRLGTQYPCPIDQKHIHHL